MGSETKVRVPVSCFAEGANGTLYVAHGDRRVKFWDGLASEFADAGIDAPTEKPEVDSSEKGLIVGIYYAYVRFLDSRGNVSNLSPLSDEHNISVTTGTIFGATNASPISISSTAHGLTTGDKVRVYGVLGNHGANGTFTITSVEVPTDPVIVKRQILRNRDGNLNTFYVDVEDETLEGTEFESTKTDEELTEEVPLSADDGTDLNVGTHSRPPNHKRVLVNHFSRLFAAVDLIHTEGAVRVTKDNDTVYGIAAGFTSEMSGRTFYPDGTNNTTSYVISSVDVDNQTLTLSEDYAGDTAAYINYAVAPEDEERLAVRYSEADSPESWDPLSIIKPTPDPGSGSVTGLMSLGTNLNVLFEHRIYSLAYVANPLKDGQLRRTAWRGCLNQRCFQVVDDTAFIMDRSGVYAFDGRSVEDLSGSIQPMFEGTSEWYLNRLNFDHAHSVYSPLEKTIRWFICLGGFRYPRHALVFHHDHSRWWIEEYEHPVPASYHGNIDNKRRVLLGMDARRVGSTKVTPLDGPSKNDSRVRSTATGGSLITIEDNGNSFSDITYEGMPIQIVTGAGAGQSRIIVKVEDTKLTIDRAWLTLPDATSVYQIGGIRWKYKTSLMRWLVDYGGTKSIRGYEVGFEPMSSDSTMIVRKFVNYDEDAETLEYDRSSVEGDGVSTEAGSADMVIDLTDTTGVVSQSLDDYITPRAKANRLFRLQLEGIPNNERQKLYEITVDGVHG